MPIITLRLILTLIDPIEIMKEFVGLVALVEIDNWMGMIFEIYLDTYHNNLLYEPSFMVLSVKQSDKKASYFYFKL